jgi:hypothetical protein
MLADRAGASMSVREDGLTGCVSERRAKRPIRGAMTAPRLGSDGNTIGKASASASAADCHIFCVGRDRLSSRDHSEIISVL